MSLGGRGLFEVYPTYPTYLQVCDKLMDVKTLIFRKIVPSRGWVIFDISKMSLQYVITIVLLPSPTQPIQPNYPKLSSPSIVLGNQAPKLNKIALY